MIVKLMPIQVPQLWEAIKFAVVATDRLTNGRRQKCLNKLLMSLLDDRSQCFVRFNEERRLLALAITSIIDGDDGKYLLIKNLYSFEKAQMEEWRDNLEFMKKFAHKSGCKKVVFQSSNDRVFELAAYFGFLEQFKQLSLDI